MELTKIGDNFAYFKNGEFDKGHIQWSELKKYKENYTIVVKGKNTKGEEIRKVTITLQVKSKPDPTQVFWLVAKVLKKVLCPECL